MMPVIAPLAALEQKVDRPGNPDGDRAWLSAFTDGTRRASGSTSCSTSLTAACYGGYR